MPICSAFNYDHNTNKVKWNIFVYVSVENLDIQIDCDAIEQGGASSTQNVSGKENVVDRRGPSSQEVLNVIADDYLKAIHPSNVEELNGFLQYMQKVRQVIIVDVKTGSLIITVRCTSLRILDELWKDYCTGHLQEVAQRYLVTEDILQQWGLDSVQLTLTISEEEYKAYRKNFLKNEGRYQKNTCYVQKFRLTRRLRSFPWDALVYASIMKLYLNLEKLGKSERCVTLWVSISRLPVWVGLKWSLGWSWSCLDLSPCSYFRSTIWMRKKKVISHQSTVYWCNSREASGRRPRAKRVYNLVAR